MPLPLWKKWLSYLAEIHLESTSSAHNPHLHLSLRQGRYQLSTANAIYSYGDLYSNFDRAFRRTDLSRLPGTEVLILGFGLGSIPCLLELQRPGQYRYTGVEIDEAVLDLANRYTLPKLSAPLELICADAAAFIFQTNATFDLICMDVFIDDEVPTVFESTELLEALRDTLSPGGLLLYNRLAAKKSDIRRTRSFFQNTFLPIFSEGVAIDVGHNWMLLNHPHLLQKPHLTIS
ncbi:MAG TPA: methyltransferase domain-containing protein [Saprospiraceae bacterium]|nr:methyltransferase domain-containing protein [Saprospiraceae bacterium]HMP22851.1 methyltransferase domain-containing protein [Saprospiraceae bacterium]